MGDLKLLQCPFCGGAAEMYGEPFEIVVECQDCGNRTSHQDSRSDAETLWNTRTPSPELEAMRGALEDARWALQGDDEERAEAVAMIDRVLATPSTSGGRE